MTRKIAAGLLLGAGSALVILLLAWTNLGGLDRLDLQLYDWSLRRLANPDAVNRDIVLVEINDASIRDYAPAVGRWPWPRVLQSNLIDFLQRAPARVIAYDIQLSERSNGSFKFGSDTWTAEESDDAMVTSTRTAGNVILLADATNPGITGGDSKEPATPEWRSPYRLGPLIEERPVITPPFPQLTDTAFGLGHNFLALDDDGVARRIAPFIRRGDRYLPSLGMAAALAAGGFRPDEVALEDHGIRVRDRRIPLVPISVPDVVNPRASRDQWTMLINYRAPVQINGQRPYPTYEARHLLVSQDLLLAGQKPLVDPAIFKDKIVFIGLTGAGLVDVFQTPMGGGLMPGIQLHASVADSVLSNRFIRIAPAGWRLASTIGAAILVGLMAALLPFAAAAGGAVVAAVSWAAIRCHRAAIGHLAECRPAPDGNRPRAVCRHRLPVFRRGLPETRRQETVRAVRVEGCVRAADGASGSRRARRQAARDVGAFFRHSRLYDGDRAGRCRSPRGAAERILLANGRDRVPSQGNGR